MTDFLGNLIMRSAADLFPSAVLQPRLPALFEPTRGETEIPMPAPDPVLRETGAPAGEPSASASSMNELPISRPTFTAEPVERERPVKPVENHIPPAPDQNARPPATETHQEVVQPATRAPDRTTQIHFVSHPEEPQPTIMQRPEGRAPQEELPPTEADRSFAPREHEKLSPAEPPFAGSPRVEMVPLSTKRIIDAPQITIRPLGEDLVFEGAPRSIVEPVPLNRGSRPGSLLRPVPTASAPARLQQDEQTQAQEQQKVIEIHIGRIEVRATPPSTPPKRTSQKAATMSLEDYLRSRPGETQ